MPTKSLASANDGSDRMSYGLGIPPDPTRNRHRWEVFVELGPYVKRCTRCFLARATPPSRHCWRDLDGDWHDGPVPRCQ